MVVVVWYSAMKNLLINLVLVGGLVYFVSIIPLCLGLIWVGLDKRKQGWHDKLAGTVVVRSKNHGPEPVRFEQVP